MVPRTAFGQIIASFCAVIGIMMLALPLGVIANNFGEYEKYSKRREKVLGMFDEPDTNLDQPKIRRSFRKIGNFTE